MAEKTKTLRQLEKDASPIIPEKTDPSNKFLSKADFVKKQETKKLRRKAGEAAMMKFDEDQDTLDKKKDAAKEKSADKAEKDADKISYAVKKGKKTLKTFKDKDEAEGFVADHKDSDKLKIVEK